MAKRDIMDLSAPTSGLGWLATFAVAAVVGAVIGPLPALYHAHQAYNEQTRHFELEIAYNKGRAREKMCSNVQVKAMNPAMTEFCEQHNRSNHADKYMLGELFQ